MRAPTYRSLETRIVFDGAAAAVVADGVADPAADAADGAHDAATSHADLALQNLAAHAADQRVEVSLTADARHEIAFIDASVDDIATLIQGLDPSVEVVLLDANRDGVEQMAEALAGRTDIDAIHIISHGREGALELGTATLDTGSMAGEHADDLAIIRGALSDQADILVYGCNFGEGEAGQLAVDLLADLTGADVAASDDATGHADLGGDWNLEVSHGDLEAKISVSFEVQQDWHHTLTTEAGGESRVNTTTSGTQQTTANSGRQIASDANGDYVVVWDDGAEVYARVFNSDGTAITSEFRVNSTTSNIQADASVAMDSDGNFVVAWKSYAQDGSVYGVYAQRYNASGVAQGSEFRVNTTTLYDQDDVAVAMSSSGFVITWTSYFQDSSGDGIYAQRYNSSGVAQGSEFRVNTTTLYDQNSSNVAMDSSGNFIVTWTSYAQDGSGYGVYAQRYNSSGVAQGSEFRVNTTTLYDQNYSSVAVDGSGNFVVTWTSYFQDGSYDGIYGQRYNSSGVAQGSEFLVNTTTDWNQSNSNVTMAADGRFIVTWRSYYQDAAATWGTYAQEFDSSGAKVGSELLVNSTTSNSQEFSDITWNNEKATIVWSGNGTGDTQGIFTQRYTTNDAPSAEAVTSTASGGLAINSSGNDAYLRADDGSAIFGGKTQISLEVRFSMSGSAASENPLVSYAVDGTSDNEIYLRILPSGRISFAINGTALTTTNAYSQLLDGSTHTLSATWNSSGGALVIYVDGVQVETFSGLKSGYTIASGGTLVLGQDQDAENANFNSAQVFSGTLYDVRVYGDIRTGTEVTNNYASDVAWNDNNLLANWKFNDLSTAGVVVDTVSGNNLTVGHATGTGFTTGSTTLSLSVDENATNGTTVGTVTGTDAERTAKINALLAADSTLRYSAETNQFYRFVNSSISWTAAEAAARSGTGTSLLSGQTGQLVVIRSAAENEVVWNLADAYNQDVWIGASDASVEGTWRWIENGVASDQFWSGTGAGSNVGGNYENWRSGQPNAATAAGDFGRMDFGTGEWTDEDTSANSRYIIEWNADDVLDATHVLTYSITSQSVSGAFTINSDTGAITVADGTKLNYESATSQNVTVRITDGQGATYDKVFTINLSNVYEAPVITSNGAGSSASMSAAENQTAVTTVTSQLDAAQSTVTYSIVGGADQAKFTINSSTGELTFVSAPNFESPTDSGGNNIYDVTVQASDGTSSDMQAIAVTVTNVNEVPVATTDTFTTNEDAQTTFDVRTNDIDHDANSLTVTHINGSAISTGGSVAVTGGSVMLNANGTLTFTPTANYSGSPSFTYTVSDGNGDTATGTVNGTVTAVNDAPVNTVGSGWTTNEDASVQLTGLAIADVDASSGAMTVTLSVPSGTLTATSGGSVTVGGSGSGTVTLTGTLANINAYLASGSAPTYVPAANANGAVTLTMTTSDGGNTGTGGTLIDTDNATITVTAVNDGPVASADSFTTNEDTPTSFDVRTNDSDVENDSLTVTHIDGNAIVTGGSVAVTGGSVTLNANGTLTFTPTTNYNGTPSFTYTVSDGNGGSSTATVNGTVTAVNDGPVASADSFTTNEDTPTSFDVRTNDSDVENDALTVTHIDGAAISTGGSVAVTGGSVTLNANGTLTFTPSANYNGMPSFTYTVSDGNGGSSTATVNGTVTAVNDGPVASGDSFTKNEDTPTTFDVRTNDSDVESDALTVTHIDGNAISTGGSVAVTGGSVTLNANGTLTFTPTGNYNGTPSFTYTVSDGNGGSSTASVNGTVTAVNDGPVASADSFTTNEDTPTTFDVRTNDSDVESDALTVTHIDGNAIVTGGSVAVTGGSVSLNANGTLTFTPTANYNGTPSFTYTVSDGNGGSSTATVNGTVTAVNDGPVASADTFTTNEDTPTTFDVRTNDSDVESDALTVTHINGTGISTGGSVSVTGGSVTLNVNGTLTFTPSANYNGAPSFTYTVSDGNGGLSTATVNGTVTAVNDGPVASGDSFTTNEDTPTTFDVRTNDSDVESDALTVTHIDGNAIVIGGSVAVTGGSVTLNANGTLTFTPTANYNGTPSFTYTVSDGNGGSSTASVNGTVTAVNDGPVASADSFTTNEDTPTTFDVRTNDSDVESDALTVTHIDGNAIVSGGSVAVTGGSVSLNANGTLTFTPTANYNGTPSFTYSVSDGNGGSSTATVNGTVTAVNDGPVASADSFTTNEDTPTSFDVRTNDSDVESDALTVTHIDGAAISTGGSVSVTGGSVTLNANGTLTFTPTANYNGTPSFTYTVSDGNGGSSTATVNGTVTAVNDGPVASGDSFTTNEDTPTTFDVRTNDSDVESDALTVTHIDGNAIVTGGSVAVTGGSVTLNASGTLTFTPTSNYNGTPSFTYTVSDGNGGSSTASVNGTVTAVNDGPVASADTFTTNEDTPTSFDVRTNDSDAENDSLTVTHIDGNAISTGGSVAVTGGSVTLNANGTLTFTPTTNYNGTPSFTYTVSDGNGGSSTATVNGTVTAVNDGPVAVVDSFTTNEDTPSTFDVRTNDSDVESDALTVTHIDGNAIATGGSVAVTGGSVTLNANGTLTFTPAANYNGTPSFTYTVSDGNGGSSTATVNGTVTAVNDGPVASGDSFTTNEDTPTTFDVRANDADVESDALTVTHIDGNAIVTGGSLAVTGGSVTLNANGTLTFTPTTNYNGTPSFTYTVSDGNGGSSTATVNGTVSGDNDAPIVAGDSFTTSEDTPTTFDVRTNDSDNDGDALTVTHIDGNAISTGGSVAVTGGSVTLNANGTLTFTPTTNYNGTPSFTYTVSDGNGGSSTATVNGTVTAVNDGPVASADTFTTNEDTPTSFDVRTNDSDAENDSLTVTHIDGNAIVTGGSVAVTGGTVTLNANGTLTFTPTANYNGTPSFTYTVSDGNGGSSTATVNGTVSGDNDAPIVAGDSFTTSEDTPTTFDVRTNDSDNDGDALTVTHIDGNAISTGGSVAVTGGSVTLNVGGTLTFTPTANYNGAPSFTYTVSDGNGGSSTATVNGTVTAVNDGPVASADTVTTNEDTPTTFDVRTNDSDVENDSLTVTHIDGNAIVIGGSVAVTGGSVSLNANGTLTFTPTVNYNGTPSFTYTVSDGSGGSSTATVNGTVTAVNDGPIASADSFTTNEDTPTTFDVRTNDTDVESDALTVTHIDGNAIVTGGSVAVTGGSVTLNASGTLTFTPTSNYNGTPSFTYTVSDGNGGSSTATVNGTVTAVNDGPVASADSFTTNEDTPTSFDVRTNDSDVENDALTVTHIDGNAIVTGGSVAVTGGSVTLNANGTLTFTPSANYNGSPSFTYTVSDGNGGSSTATVNGTVTAVNDGPVASADSFTTNEDTPSTFDVRTNDSDVESDALTVTHIDGNAISTGGSVAVAGGSVTLNANGTLTFTPTANYNGSPSFTCTVSDGNGGSSTATVNGTVTAVNDGPVASGDSFTTNEDTPATFDVRTNDADVESDALTVTHIDGNAIVTGGSVAVTGGTVTLNANGTLTFTPTTNYNGTPSFTYTVSDGNGGSSTATVNGTVSGDNDAPIVAGDSFTTSEDTPTTFDVRTNDSDNDGDALTVTHIDGNAISTGGSVAVTGGSVTLNVGGTLTFTPTANYNGAPSFTYTVSDGNGGSSTATVSGTVTAVNDGPVASTDTFTTNEDTPTTFDVRTNDSDVDGNALAVSHINGTAISTGGSVAVTGGSVTLNANGTLTFTPTANYNGTPSFTYTVSDGNGGSSTATVSGTVTAVNDGPVASTDTFTTNEDAPATFDVRTNDSDVEADALTVTHINGAAIATGGSVAVTGGTVTLNANGTLTFTPTANYNGTPSFTYTVSDGNGGSSTATVNGTVTAVNDGPVASTDSFTTNEDIPTTFDVRGNDSDVEGNALTVTRINGTLIASGGSVVVTGGSVKLNANGTLTFTPTANYNGTPSFTYTVSDGNGGSSTATVNGTVTAVNDGPVASADTFTTNEDTPTTIDVRGNDSDVEGNALTVTRINGTAIATGGSVAVTGGSVTLNANGTLTFTPTASYNGTPSFTYTVSDGHGGTSTATVNGTVTAVNDGPVASGDSFTTNEDTPTTFDVRGNDSDANGDDLTVSHINGTAISSGGSVAVTGGSVTLNANGTLTFTPKANYNGTPSFTYTVSDGHGGTTTATVNGTVTAVNDAATGGVSIDRTGPDGCILTADTSRLADADGVGTLRYVWMRDGVAIDGATASTYRATADDDGHTITVAVSFTDGDGANEQKTATGVAIAAPTPPDDPVTVPIEDVDTQDGDDEEDDVGTGVVEQPGPHHFIHDTVVAIGGSGAADAEQELPITATVAWAAALDVPLDIESTALTEALGLHRHSSTAFSSLADLLAPQRTLPEAHADISIDSDRNTILFLDLSQLAVPGSTLDMPDLGGQDRYGWTDYTVTLADGSALPDWLSRPDRSIVSGVVPEGVEAIDLAITIRHADGAIEEATISIDVATGQVVRSAAPNAPQAPLFSDQFEDDFAQ